MNAGVEAPGDKLLRRGGGALSDAELVAALLRSGTAGHPAVAIAGLALRHAGSLRALLDMDAQELRRLHGIGPARCAQLLACMELGRRYLEARATERPAIESRGDIRRLLTARLRPRRREVFACLYLDSRLRVFGYEELFTGTLDGAPVYPREVARRCLEQNAGAVIVAHNHPSGDAEPSAADRGITARLKEALAVLDIRLVDHYIVGDGVVASLAERGWL